jgi:sucrose phosphorylase
LTELKRLLAIRKDQQAFHPDATQEVLALGDEFFGIRRVSEQTGQDILAISNLTEWPQHLCLQTLTGLSLKDYGIDLIVAREIERMDETTILQPYQTMWLTDKV